MLRTPEEIALLAHARQPGIRDPHRPEYGITNILADFMAGLDFAGQRVLELGPGHYEFCEAVRARGAVVEAVDIDPCVVELGRRRGFGVHSGDLVRLGELGLPGPYDGLFCKGSYNPFWFYHDEAALRRFIASLLHLLTPGGWAWIVAHPATELPLSTETWLGWLDRERSIYSEFGCQTWEPAGRLSAAFYGISYVPPRLVVYTRNLVNPRWAPSSIYRFLGFFAQAGKRRLRRIMGL